MSAVQRSSEPPAHFPAAQNEDPMDPMDEDIRARQQPLRNPQSISRLGRRSFCTRQEISSRK